MNGRGNVAIGARLFLGEPQEKIARVDVSGCPLKGGFRFLHQTQRLNLDLHRLDKMPCHA